MSKEGKTKKTNTRKWVTDLNEEKKQKLKPLIEQLQIGIWVASIMNQEAAELCEKREPRVCASVCVLYVNVINDPRHKQ